jgi:hypothetical protein
MWRRESRQARPANLDQRVLQSAFLGNGHDSLRLSALGSEEIEQAPEKERNVPAVKEALAKADQDSRSCQPDKSGKDRRKQLVYPSHRDEQPEKDAKGERDGEEQAQT